MGKKLWEIKHPYYFSAPDREEYASWDDFIREMGDADDDYNLLIRFDWQEGKEEGVPEGHSRLALCYFHQRKGRVSAHEVVVSMEDEPKIREWLAAKWAYLAKVWEPISIKEPAPAEAP